ncbi:hypothetical protein [Bacteroides oleiciplenus]|nr:hypothetical protein [Bacteroides oleiciplenus]
MRQTSSIAHKLPVKVDEFLHQTNYFALQRLTNLYQAPFGKHW